MAERWAVATGNWSAVGTWDGGASLPTAGDVVHANGFTVTVNQSITVGSLRTTAGTTAAAGGLFNSSVAAIVIIADVIAGITNCLNLNAGGILNGNTTGGSSANAYGAVMQQGSVHNGNSTGGSGSSAHGSFVQNGAVQNGNSTGGTLSGAYGSHVSAGAIQNGNSLGSATAGSYGTNLQYGAVQNGNSTGGTAAGCYGTRVVNGGIFYGAATGGSNATAYGTYLFSPGALAIVTGLTAGTAKGLYMGDDTTVILLNGVQSSAMDTSGTRNTISAQQYPFVARTRTFFG